MKRGSVDMSDTPVAVTIRKSVYEKIQAGDYETKLEYPKSVKKPRILETPAGMLTPEAIAALPNIIQEFESEKKAVGELRAAYHEDVNRLEKQFQIDLEEENDMTGHPKAGLLFDKAWEMGHSSGLSEVHNYYVDLLDLVK